MGREIYSGSNTNSKIHTLTRRALLVSGLGLALGGAEMVRKALSENHTPVWQPTPVPEMEPAPAQEAVDYTRKHSQFKFLSEIPYNELGDSNYHLIERAVTDFADFDLPQEVIIKKDWRSEDGGYTNVSPRKTALSDEDESHIIIEPGRIEIASDLFRGIVKLEKKQLELQHAAAELIFVNFLAAQDKPEYRSAREKGASSAKTELLAVHDRYTMWHKRASKNPSIYADSKYPKGFYVFNEYTYIDEDDKDEADSPRQNRRMATDIADYAASVINTSMLHGINMAQRIHDFPIQLKNVPDGMGVTASYYTPSAQRVLARDGYDTTMELLRTLVKLDVRKPQDAPARLIRKSREIYDLIHDDSPENNRIEIVGYY